MLVPSQWNGQYTCPDDHTLQTFTMNVTRSGAFNTIASVDVNGEVIPMSGAYAIAYNVLTLHNDVPISRVYLSDNYTTVVLNAILANATYVSGTLIFSESNKAVNCSVSMTRTKGNYSDFSYVKENERSLSSTCRNRNVLYTCSIT